MTTNIYVPTSMSRRLIARMQATHHRRRISVFAGPPGIGKTTAINVLRCRHPREIAVIKISRQNAKEVLTLKHVLESIRKLSSSSLEYIPTSIWELRKSVFVAISEWAGADPRTALKTSFDFSASPPLTIIFDEAQNLSRQSIESLRYWNDHDLCYSPFPIGLIFVGNSEFSLSPSNSGESAVSAAVADRALYMETLDYEDVTDDDLTLFLQANGFEDSELVAILLHAFGGQKAVRSLRRLIDFLDDLQAMSGGKIQTASDVREALQFV